jgi:hypothetical protein
MDQEKKGVLKWVILFVRSVVVIMKLMKRKIRNLIIDYLRGII